MRKHVRRRYDAQVRASNVCHEHSGIFDITPGGQKARTALAARVTDVGRLFAESLENVRAEPVLAIASTGASPLAVASYGTVPLSLGALGVHTLFRLEWNVRQATVVGMIGAGGIGQALFEAQQLFFYRQMIAYLLITWVIVLAVDRISAWTRGRVGGIQLAPEETVR